MTTVSSSIRGVCPFRPTYVSFQKHFCSQTRKQPIVEEVSIPNKTNHAEDATEAMHRERIIPITVKSDSIDIPGMNAFPVNVPIRKEEPQMQHEIPSSFEELLRATNIQRPMSPTTTETSSDSSLTQFALPGSCSLPSPRKESERSNQPKRSTAVASKESNVTGYLMPDGEEVWCEEVENAFQEALIKFPSIGRAKIFMEDDGKYYGI